MSTRSAVDEIRHSTDEVLNAFLKARQHQARNHRKELRAGDIARRNAMQTMMEAFRQTREETSRRYMKALHQSVMEAKQDVDANLRQIASKRRKFAAAQARFLAKTHECDARTRNEVMQDLAAAREHATHEVQDDLKRFAETLHSDVERFRRNLRKELGTDQRQPRKNLASKSSASTARKAAGKPGSAQGAKRRCNGKGQICARCQGIGKVRQGQIARGQDWEIEGRRQRYRWTREVNSAARPADRGDDDEIKPIRRTLRGVSTSGEPTVAINKGNNNDERLRLRRRCRHHAFPACP